MGFSGGGSNVLLPHTHDGTVAQDGGPLNFNNVTQGQMNSGDITYSDGVHLQQLAIGNPADQLTVSGGLPAWTAGAAPPTSVWTKLGSYTVVGAPVTDMDVTWSLASTKDFMQIYVYTIGAGVVRRYLQFYDSASVLDAGANYNAQFSSNVGAPASSGANVGIIGYDNNNEADFIQVSHPDPTQEAITCNVAVNNVPGVANAPTNRQIWGKWANPSSITGIRITNAGAGGTYGVGSSVLVLGTDL